MTKFVLNYAIKKQILDIPNQRSSHQIPTPRGGGIAIALAFYLGLFLLNYIGHIDYKTFLVLLLGIPLAILGWIDDLKNLSVKIRMGTQFLIGVSAILVLRGLPSDYFSIIEFFFGSLMIVWFINLYNFLDGLDGYLITHSIFVSLFMFFFSKSAVYLVLFSSLLGFLPWNWHKAKIFTGDIGSTLIGYLFIIMSLINTESSFDKTIIYLVLSSPFWLDASSILTLRILNKERFWEPHKKHAYQRLNQVGFRHDQVCFISILTYFFTFGIAYLFDKDIINIYAIAPTTIICLYITFFLFLKAKCER